MLVPHAKPKTTSFLWPNSNEYWNSQYLSTILNRETLAAFDAPLNISTNQHVTIALSRHHLEGKGFKRYYDTEKATDLQATRVLSTVGRLYARGLEEAAGCIKARRVEFRAVN